MSNGNKFGSKQNTLGRNVIVTIRSKIVVLTLGFGLIYEALRTSWATPRLWIRLRFAFQATKLVHLPF